MLVLTSLLAMTSPSISQNSSDSVTCIPNSALRTAVKLIEKGKLDSAELKVMRETVSLLNQRIQAKDLIIAEHQGKEQTYKLLAENFENQKKGFLDIVKLTNEEVMILRQDVKRQKRKTFFVGLAGIVATGLTIYLTSK